MANGGALERFLIKNGIDIDWYKLQRNHASKIPRFARIVKDFGWFLGEEEEGCRKRTFSQADNDDDDNDSLKEMRILYETKDIPYIHRTNVLTLPTDLSLNQNIAYQKGRIFGMDLASIFACELLDPQPNDTVLDIGCAPGAKLALIADLMDRKGMLLGVDNSRHRLFTCRSLLRKYQIDRSTTTKNDWYVGIFQADGRTFKPELALMDHPNIIFDSIEQVRLRNNIRSQKRLSIKGQNEVKAQRAARMISQEQNLLFSKIIVDAECTHDGSLRHVEKSLDSSESAEKVVVVEDNQASFLERDIQELNELQYNLLLNGFRLLKPGGILVYSTCSFCKSQNEDVVQRLLDNELHAKVRLLPDMPGEPSAFLKGASLFCPTATNTSGLFIVSISKTKTL